MGGSHRQDVFDQKYTVRWIRASRYIRKFLRSNSSAITGGVQWLDPSVAGDAAAHTRQLEWASWQTPIEQKGPDDGAKSWAGECRRERIGHAISK